MYQKSVLLQNMATSLFWRIVPIYTPSPISVYGYMKKFLSFWKYDCAVIMNWQKNYRKQIQIRLQFLFRPGIPKTSPIIGILPPCPMSYRERFLAWYQVQCKHKNRRFYRSSGQRQNRNFLDGIFPSERRFLPQGQIPVFQSLSIL